MFKLTQLITVFLLVTAVAAQAADNVAINVTGKVVASPCTVTSPADIPVDLGQNIQASSLATAGAASDWTAFQITLGSCPAGTTKATITFSGTPDGDNPADQYKNTGTATNVAVQLQGSGGDQFGNGKSFTGVILSDHTYTYNLKARAYSNAGGVTPGTISAVIVATFTYQ
ncbi:fimbrial protein [Enterobacter sp. 22452]|uniref:fimbrial protein n=1 Tax=Enterobacter TaxID=547 RepID=UPI003F8708EA